MTEVLGVCITLSSLRLVTNTATQIKRNDKFFGLILSTRRTWKPNTHDKSFYSEILKRKIDIEVTTKALRCIRKYGGFDNYLLLTKPENLDSLYGEYLRKLLMTKLNNPDFEVPYIVKSRPIVFKAHRKHYKFA
jgi:ribosomal protein L28